MARPGSKSEKMNTRVRDGNIEKLKNAAKTMNYTSRYEDQDVGSIGKMLDAIAECPPAYLRAIAAILHIEDKTL